MLQSTNSPFEYTGRNVALDFANTVENRNRENRKELLTDYSRLVEWARGANLITFQAAARMDHVARQTPERAQSALRQAIRLREALHAIFTAAAEGRKTPAEGLASLNDAVRTASAHARLTHSNGGLAWEWIEPDHNLGSPMWPVAQAAAQLLTSEELAFVRCCAADSCRWLFLDKTKNHRRRWCEMKTCGNRYKARRYYQRQKSGINS